ncbi:alpha/beta fold hydrolase [Sporolactobacillus shoreae]|uniref:Alpha/beta fold hydrolase n=1 Tax=Sporolactobacillus shoreae TaxID=1465501 RepID=A0A4Z0GKA9_9BACL|nr:alpha/beta fold hydrolase [Sporolactobacillus shoreae]TGA97349.1 alpha/beta fold hydrolase [Sporolactobacillus shoreae]
MAKIRPPRPFLFEGGKRAVLLLHGFTGNSADVRQIGRFLNKRGYTCYGPHYSGHGVPPEELVKTTPDDWWWDVQEAYQFLENSGFREIAVCGLSIGGVFSLKCGYTFPVRGIVPMCAPADTSNESRLYAGAIGYARNYKMYQEEPRSQIDTEMAAVSEKMPELLSAIGVLIREVRSNLHRVTAPAFIVQAALDEMINPDSADIIYHEIQSKIRQLKWYGQSTHVITLGTEKAQLHEDIYAFLESLDWSVS